MARRDIIPHLPGLNRVLLSDLNRDRATVRQVNNQILGGTMLLLSNRASASTEQKTERAKQDSANNGTTRDTPATNPLDIIGGSLNGCRRNVVRVEVLLLGAHPVKGLIHHAAIALQLDNASLARTECGGLELGGLRVLDGSHGVHTTSARAFAQPPPLT